MIEIIPSILTNDPKELEEKLSLCEGVVDRVSIDIIDGKFVNNKTIDPSFLEGYETDLKLDFQLMVVEPVNWIEKCVRAQADRIIGHIEHMSDQLEFVSKVQEVGAFVGLGVDINTPISALDPTIINNLDIILVMSVPAGFGGQEFNKESIDKIKKLNEIRLRDKTPFKIQDDGGVSLQYIEDIRKAGVDEVSIGKKLFAGSLKENIEKYKKAAYERR